MEFYKGWRIYLPETGLMVKPLTTQECSEYLTYATEKEIEEQQPIIHIPSSFGDQLTLF
jgi:hypothetical protein